jgi:sugar phosphate isomerase/epimerase
MKLSCADFTWPLLPHQDVLRLIHSLAIEGLDLGVFAERSHIRPEIVRQDIPMWAGILRERIRGAGLELADVFVQNALDFETMAPNNPDSSEREAGMRLFLDMLELARRLEAPGLTILPGARFGDEPWNDAISRSAEGLKARVDAAAAHGLQVSVEGHVGSCVDTPEKLAQLVELTPGLRLTLDYTHYAYAGIPDAEVEPLIPHARHFQARGACRGKLQAKFGDNSIDYRRILQRLQETGYAGFFAIEYVWTEWQHLNETDNVCETILMRDFVRATLAGEAFTAPAARAERLP